MTAALAAGEVHRYRLPLAGGQFVRFVIDQHGIDAGVRLEDPGGEILVEADRLIDDRGSELILAVSERPGSYSLVVHGLADSGPGRYEARVEAWLVASAEDRLNAEAYRRFTAAERLKPDEGVAECERALATWRDLGEVALEAEALERLGRRHYDAREWEKATDRYRQAAMAFERAGDRRWEALVRTNLASTLLPLGEAEEAAQQSVIALNAGRRLQDRWIEAKSLHLLGQASQNQGELQTALDNYEAALALLPAADRRLRPLTLHHLGVLHARFLGDPARGRDLLAIASAAWPPGHPWQARTLNQLGRLAQEQRRLDEAGKHYAEALALPQEKERCGSAVTRARLALVDEAQGDSVAADARVAEALRLVTDKPCPRSQGTVLLLTAGLAESRGESAESRASYRRAVVLFEEQGDRSLLAESLAGVARTERRVGTDEAALEASSRSLQILSGVRPTILREDLRTSFNATAQRQVDFHIGLLLDMGADGDAWVAAEEARARSLRDLLAEAGAGLRGMAAPALVARERDLQRRLNAIETRRLETSESAVEKHAALRRSLDDLVVELESLRGEIRRVDRRPTRAPLDQPISRAALQGLLDSDTLLLEIRLADDASHLWVVSRDALRTFRLPPREPIEKLAAEVGRWMKSLDWPGRNPAPLCELSRLVLGPAAALLGQRRLVLVMDGALESTSFAALPDPADPASCADARPLGARHEIVHLPSAATLLATRAQRASRKPAAGWVAVVADPVYSAVEEPSHFRRLPYSAEEAAAILAPLDRSRTFLAQRFAASKATVTAGGLAGFRVLHFATHGVLDPERPLLSYLALTQVDPQGGALDSALAAHEIYDLDLPAELVVLSGCETALGRSTRGEGLVSGLPRAFLYAGASRVLLSLWAVEDRSTRDLMELFYRGLLQRRLAPARALQEAQQALRSRGHPPYQWAGFVLLGDWRALPRFSG